MGFVGDRLAEMPAGQPPGELRRRPAEHEDRAADARPAQFDALLHRGDGEGAHAVPPEGARGDDRAVAVCVRLDDGHQRAQRSARSAARAVRQAVSRAFFAMAGAGRGGKNCSVNIGAGCGGDGFSVNAGIGHRREVVSVSVGAGCAGEDFTVNAGAGCAGEGFSANTGIERSGGNHAAGAGTGGNEHRGERVGVVAQRGQVDFAPRAAGLAGNGYSCAGQANAGRRRAGCARRLRGFRGARCEALERCARPSAPQTAKGGRPSGGERQTQRGGQQEVGEAVADPDCLRARELCKAAHQHDAPRVQDVDGRGHLARRAAARAVQAQERQEQKRGAQGKREGHAVVARGAERAEPERLCAHDGQRCGEAGGAQRSEAAGSRAEDVERAGKLCAEQQKQRRHQCAGVG